MVGNQTPSMTDYSREGHDKPRKERGSDPTPGTNGPGDPHGKMSPIKSDFENQRGLTLETLKIR